MSELQTVSVTIGILTACISVVIGVVNQIVSRRRTEKTEQLALETRQAQLFMQIYNRWTSKDMAAAYGLVRYKYTWNDLDEAFRKYGPAVDIDAYSNNQILHNFYEGVGILVKRNLIDISMVEDLFAQRIMWHWERFKPAFMEHRERIQDYTRYDSIEYLYNLMKQRQQQQQITPSP